MVIINYKAGQLANRIWNFSSFIANSIEHDYRLINPEFDEYCEYFEATSTNRFDHYPITTTLTGFWALDRTWSFLFRLQADITHKLFTSSPTYKLYRIFTSHDKKLTDYNLNNPDFLVDAKNRRVIVEGWFFRDLENIKKHADLIRKFFTPIESYRTNVQQIISQCKTKGDVIVGVHIRRGDYARFQKGIYYYEDEVYFNNMLAVQTRIEQEGKKCVFLICSNEKIDTKNYSGLNVEVENRHFIVDLYSLAKCDYIIGPPSTFTLWASFYGQVPFKFITDKQTVFNDLSEFKLEDPIINF